MPFGIVSCPRSGYSWFVEYVKHFNNYEQVDNMNYRAILIPHISNILKEFMEQYPKFKIIHLVRNPLDVCASFHKYFRENEIAEWWTEFFSKEELLKYKNSDRHVQVAMAYKKHVDDARKCNGNPNFMEISYEFICTQPLKAINTIEEFIDEKFTKEHISFFIKSINYSKDDYKDFYSENEIAEILKVINNE